MSQKYHYLVRRLHSFSGVFPVGIFLMMHLFINSFVLRGEESFNWAVSTLSRISILPYLEILLIGVPIAFHALYGLWVTYVTKSNVLQYKYFRNWMFYLQRVTAVITLAFVSWHVYVLRIARAITGEEMSFQIVSGWLSDPLYFTIYVVGFLAAVFHFSNGLWSFLITWGITIGSVSRRAAAYLCALIFAVLGVAGISILYCFVPKGGGM